MIRAARPRLVVETLDSAEREAFRQASLPVRDRYLQATGPAGGELLQTFSTRSNSKDAGPVRSPCGPARDQTLELSAKF